MTVVGLHAGWAWVVVLANAASGVWALGAHWVPPLRGRPLWWFVIAAEAAIFVQVGLGVALVAGEGRTIDQFHMFYGFVSLIAVAILYSYRQQLDPWRYLLYGFGGLFLMGMAIRAMLIG